MGSAEQHSLQHDRHDDRHSAAQAPQDDAPEDHLLDDRRGHHRCDHQRNDVHAVRRDLPDRVGVVRDRKIQCDHDRTRCDLGAERSEPDDRTPSEIRPLWPQTDVGAEITGAPPPTREPAPPHRRAVGHRDEQGDVHHDRPSEPDDGVEEVLGHHERGGEDTDGTDRGNDGQRRNDGCRVHSNGRPHRRAGHRGRKRSVQRGRQVFVKVPEKSFRPYPLTTEEPGDHPAFEHRRERSHLRMTTIRVER